MDSHERGMNPVAITMIHPLKEYWPSQRFEKATSSSQVSTLTTDLQGLCNDPRKESFLNPLPDDKF